LMGFAFRSTHPTNFKRFAEAGASPTDHQAEDRYACRFAQAYAARFHHHHERQNV